MPRLVSLNFNGSKRPQELTVAMRNFDDHEGRPSMIARFCITMRGLAPIRVATSSAIMQLAMASSFATGTPSFPFFTMPPI